LPYNREDDFVTQRRESAKNRAKAEGTMSQKSSHDTDVSFIQALAELLRENDLTELQVKREYGENDSLNVRVSRQTQVMVQASVPAAPAVPATPATPATPAAAAAPAVDNADPASHPGAVTSPMVGTCYMAAEPGAAPFVSIGATVKEGDTLLIIEAMKTMNHIPAPRAGTVKRILVEDGAPVEFGAPLVIIE
jgi:acetyl-CoA carboxylase biotin carboxyl carrier protein